MFTTFHLLVVQLMVQHQTQTSSVIHQWYCNEQHYFTDNEEYGNPTL